MEVAAINGLRNSTTTYSFGNRKNREPQEQTKSTNTLSMGKTVPVMVLMAMNPSLINANLPKTEVLEGNMIVAAAPETPKSEAPAYIMAPEPQSTQQSNPEYPYGWETFKYNHVKYSKKIKSQGVEYNVLYTNMRGMKDNEIYEIYLVPTRDAGRKVSGEYHPPVVRALIIHNLGEPNEYSTVKTMEDIVDASGKKPLAFCTREIPIDESTAQHIYDLVYGDPKYTKWVNKTDIVVNLTDDPNMMKKRVVYR